MIKHLFTISSVFAAAKIHAALFSTSIESQSSVDLWDVSQNGGQVTSTSGAHSIAGTLDGMFGGGANLPGVIEAENTLFADFQPAGFLHYIEWRTASPISLTGYTLFAGTDSDGGNRAFNEFRLMVYVEASLSYELVDSFSVTMPAVYLGGETRTFAALVGQQWRAEFVQFAEPSTASGPRILELDAIATSVVPEPETYALFSAVGLFAFAGWRRLRRPEGTDSVAAAAAETENHPPPVPFS